MPVAALLSKRPYGTGLSVATAPAHPLSCSSLRRASGYALRNSVITTYYEDGSVRMIIYQSSRAKDDTTTVLGHRLGDMSAEDLFMRGVLATVKKPRSLRVTDSTHTFFHNGKVDRKTFFRDGFTYEYIYDQDWKLRYIEKTQ